MSPRDPRFLCLTPDEVETEFWAYQYADNPRYEESEDEDFDLSAVLDEIERQGQSAADAADDWEDVIND